MKKLLVTFMVSTLLVLGCWLSSTATVHAVSPSGLDVYGYIKDQNGHPVTGAKVFVLCTGEGKYADNLTAANGFYTAAMDSTLCPVGAVIKVTAYTNNFQNLGEGSGTRHGDTLRIDAVIGLTIPIPEYGLFGTIFASAAGVGIIVITRRRCTQIC